MKKTKTASRSKTQCRPVLAVEMIPVWPKGSGPGGWRIKFTRREPGGGISTDSTFMKNFDAAADLIRSALAVDGYEPQEDS